MRIEQIYKSIIDSVKHSPKQAVIVVTFVATSLGIAFSGCASFYPMTAKQKAEKKAGETKVKNEVMTNFPDLNDSINASKEAVKRLEVIKDASVKAIGKLNIKQFEEADLDTTNKVYKRIDQNEWRVYESTKKAITFQKEKQQALIDSAYIKYSKGIDYRKDIEVKANRKGR